MKSGTAHALILEFARVENAGDPYAFRFAPQEYLLRGSGGSFETAELRWDAALLADLEAVRLPGRDPVVVQRVGELLRRFLAPTGWAEHEAACIAALKDGHRVLLTIRSAAAELYTLPWELLTLKATGQHLGELPNVLLRYEWPDTHSAAERSPRLEGGRILFAWSAAGGAVPAAEQLAAISIACGAGTYPFSEKDDVLSDASAGRLVKALNAASQKGRPIEVLHILCHGSQSGSSFGLALDGEDAASGPAVLDAGRLRQLLSPFASMVRLVVLSACDSSNSGALGNQLGSVAQTLHRAGFAAVLASRYPLSFAGSIRLTESLYTELLCGPVSVETALLLTRRRLSEDATHFDWASLQLYARSEDGDDSRPLLIRPYRGLLAFLPEHSRFFFGREREIEKIIQALTKLESAKQTRFLIVAGASGTGKSSVVMAGVIPAILAAVADIRLLRMRPGNNPLQTLTGLLPEHSTDQATDPASDPRQTLLLVDQLEEIFTHTQENREREQFIKRLFQLAADPKSKVSILATLRVDYIGRCGEVVVDQSGRRLDQVAYDEAHRVFIGQLSPEALKLAIEQPARKVGLHLEEGLASRMLEDVAGEPGALPLLADTLDILWQRRSESALTQDAYTAIGGVTGALRGRAEALIGKLDDAEQRIVRRLLVRLVSIGDDVALGTRRRVLVSKLRPEDPKDAARFDHVMALFVEARLLVLDGAEQTQTLEVAHEALIRGWQRLVDWVKEDRKMMVDLEKLESWIAQSTEHETLLTGGQLAAAEDIAAKYPKDLSKAVVSRMEQSRKRARISLIVRRASVAGVFIAMLIFARLWWNIRDAHERTARATKSVTELIQRSSNDRNSAEMHMTLAKIKLEVDESPGEALVAIEKAHTLSPNDPEIMADRVACLMVNERLKDTIVAAEEAYPLQNKAEGKVLVSAVGWAATRFTVNRPAMATWAPRLVSGYAELGDGASPFGLNPGVIQLLGRNQMLNSPLHAVAIGEVLAVFKILTEPKTAASGNAMRKILGLNE